MDKLLGNEREIVGMTPAGKGIKTGAGNYVGKAEYAQEHSVTKGFSEWEGYNVALKPAYENIIVAMKPIEKNFTNNALVHGVAGINIDAGRIGLRTKNESGWSQTGSKASENRAMSGPNYERPPRDEVGKGRWPSNLILQHHPECKLIGKKKVKGKAGGSGKGFDAVKGFGQGATSTTKGERITKSELSQLENAPDETIEEYSCHPDCPIFQLNSQVGIKKSGTNCVRTKEGFFLEHGGMGKAGDEQITYEDTGYVSRYFLNLPPETQRMVYSSKASKRERNKGCENLYWKRDQQVLISREEWDTLPENERSFGNIHSTIKPLSLIKYLVGILKMPQNTLLLDMFAGSGTMGVACEQLKIPYILMEKEEEYCDIIRARVAAANQPDKPTKKKKTPKPTNTLLDWDELEIKEEL